MLLLPTSRRHAEAPASQTAVAFSQLSRAIAAKANADVQVVPAALHAALAKPPRL